LPSRFTVTDGRSLSLERDSNDHNDVRWGESAVRLEYSV
jgi:hypothetical protein